MAGQSEKIKPVRTMSIANAAHFITEGVSARSASENHIASKTQEEDATDPASDMLYKAQTGCEEARTKLAKWVYQEGLSYFSSRVRRESLLSYAEAQDLAGESLLEFQKALPRIISLPRYVRRMLRNNLIRHLSRKRIRRSRELPGEDLAGEKSYLEAVSLKGYSESTGLTDKEQLRIHISLKRLQAADEIMKQIWSYRMAEEPLGYKEIGDILGVEDAALRMRVARFCRSVRNECLRAEKRKQFLKSMMSDAI